MKRKGYALLAAFTIGGLALAAGATAAHERSAVANRSEEHTSELQSRLQLVCRLLLEKKNRQRDRTHSAGAPLCCRRPTRLSLSRARPLGPRRVGPASPSAPARGCCGRLVRPADQPPR